MALAPAFVQAVLNKPGFYCFIGHHSEWYFEVDSEGTIHQLKYKTFERDGVLSPDGWVGDCEGRVSKLRVVADD